MTWSKNPPVVDTQQSLSPGPWFLAKYRVPWSRFIGALVLLVAVTFRILDIAPVEVARLWYLDIQMRLAASSTTSSAVAVVDIDEQSLERFGQWPWPRHILASLVDRLAEGGARVVVFDILFAEADRMSPDVLAKELPDLPIDLRARLAEFGYLGTKLAQSMSRVDTVTASALADQISPNANTPPPSRLAVRGNNVRIGLPVFPGHIRTHPTLEEAGIGDGIVNLYPELDGAARRVPTVFRIGDQLHPSLALEAARTFAGQQSLLVEGAGTLGGIDGIRIGSQFLRTDALGRVWVDLGATDRIPTLSAHMILDGKADGAIWRDRIVLIGTSASGIGSHARAPDGEILTALNFQALAVDTLVSGTVPSRPGHLEVAEILAGTLLGLLILVLLPGARIYWKCIAGAGTVALCLCVTTLAAQEARLLVDGTFPIGIVLLMTGSFILADFRREIVERHRGEVALRRYDAYIRNVVDASFDAIITLDGQGYVRTVNSAAERLFGGPSPTLIGSGIHKLLSGPWAGELGDAPNPTLSRAVRDRAVIGTGIRRVGEAEPLIGEITLAETTTGTGDIFVMVLRDVTARKQAEADAAAAAHRLRGAREAVASLQIDRENADKANLAKSEFLASMSHELRTPLNAILGFAQLLLYAPEEPLSADQDAGLNQILSSGRHLLGLIDEILDLAKIEAGQMSFAIDDVSVASVVSECRDMTEFAAGQRGIDLSIEIAGDRRVRADPTRFKQVMLNLMSNAVKYNREGGSIVVSTTVDTPGMVRVRVQDTGHGISEDRAEDVFRPFVRIDPEKAAATGTGIGLSICRRMVEAMGGRMDFESEVGTGSTFWAELPESTGSAMTETTVKSAMTFDPSGPRKSHLHDDHSDEPAKASAGSATDIQTANAAESDTAAEISGMTRSVLYIDDDPANVMLMQSIVAREKHIKFHSAPTGELGLEMAQGNPPDLILLDINLPGLDGYEVQRQLRAIEETRNVPVVGLSANAYSSDIERALKAGFDQYLTKPLNVQETRDILARYLFV